jgi:hypothetical protein
VINVAVENGRKSTTIIAAIITWSIRSILINFVCPITATEPTYQHLN